MTRDPHDVDWSSVVHSDPGVSGGTPVFRGTRVPAQTLFDYLEVARRSIGSWISFRPSRERRPFPPWTSPESPPWPVRVQLDENLPRDLVAEVTGHDVTTVQAAGRSGIDNGDLCDAPTGGLTSCGPWIEACDTSRA